MNNDRFWDCRECGRVHRGRHVAAVKCTCSLYRSTGRYGDICKRTGHWVSLTEAERKALAIINAGYIPTDEASQ